MSASALLLHRMLLTSGQRGWSGAGTSHGEAPAGGTQAPPQGNVSSRRIPVETQIVNTDSPVNADRAESPQYFRAKQRNPSHA